MRINGIDARTYKARQLNVKIQPPATAVNYDWNDGDMKPNVYKTEEKAGELELTMYFVGKTKDEVMRCISEFLMNFDTVALMELEGYRGTFYGIKKSASITDTLEARKKKLTMKFDGYMYDREVQKVLKAEQTYTAQGTRRTPCTLVIENKTRQTQETTITGLSEDPITAAVPAQKTLIIDGDSGLVTIDGANGFASIVEMWEFPYMKKGNVIIRQTNTENVKVTVKYSPMWI